MNAQHAPLPRFSSDRELSATRDSVVQTLERGIAPSVCDLIDAAGPLSLRDIAAGLDVSLHQASNVVGWMLEHDCLREDEWDRACLPLTVLESPLRHL
jgi:hypothetical protein